MTHKRSRSGSLDEGEIEVKRCKRPSCDACSGDAGGGGSRSGAMPVKKKRNRVRPGQLPVLETAFEENPGPPTERRRDFARLLGMCECQLQIWFQNRRAKAKMLEKRRRELGYIEEPPPPKTPPPLGAGYKPLLEALLHEDDLILMLLTSSVTVGNWVRFKELSDESDLVVYFCDARSSFTWFVRHAGYSFKMEFTADIVKSARLDNTEPMKGALIFELVRPPTTYMDFRREDGTNEWREVQDWTPNSQASTCLIHRLDGLAAPLSHVLRGWQDRIRGDTDFVHFVDPTRREHEHGINWTPYPPCYVPSMVFSPSAPSFQFTPTATHFGSTPIVHHPAPSHPMPAPSHAPSLLGSPAAYAAWSGRSPPPHPAAPGIPILACGQATSVDYSYGTLSAPVPTTHTVPQIAAQPSYSPSYFPSYAPSYAPIPVSAISSASGVFYSAGNLEAYSNPVCAAVNSDATVAITAGHYGEPADLWSVYPANMPSQHHPPTSAATTYDGYYVTGKRAASTSVYGYVETAVTSRYPHMPCSSSAYATEMGEPAPTASIAEDRSLALASMLPAGTIMASINMTPAAHLQTLSNAHPAYSWPAPGQYEYVTPATLQTAMYQQADPAYAPVGREYAPEQVYGISAYGYEYYSETSCIADAPAHAGGAWANQSVRWV